MPDQTSTERQTAMFWRLRSAFAQAVTAADNEKALEALMDLEIMSDQWRGALLATARRFIADAQRLDLGPRCEPGEHGIAGFRFPASFCA